MARWILTDDGRRGVRIDALTDVEVLAHGTDADPARWAVFGYLPGRYPGQANDLVLASGFTSYAKACEALRLIIGTGAGAEPIDARRFAR